MLAKFQYRANLPLGVYDGDTKKCSSSMKKGGLADSATLNIPYSPCFPYIWLETFALSELQQHKLQVCENNWIRRIAGVKRVERRRMKDLREEVGTKACIVGKIVKSRMKWAGHMVSMKDEILPKRSRRLRKTRNTAAKMGGLCEERCEKGR